VFLTSKEKRKLQVAEFRLSRWLNTDINSALGCLHRVDVSSVADVSEAQGLCTVGDFLCMDRFSVERTTGGGGGSWPVRANRDTEKVVKGKKRHIRVPCNIW
jgi:hypothetical protein